MININKITMLSTKDEKYISEASMEALKSPVLMRHGAIAVANGKIIGRGHNDYRTTSKDNFITDSCTMHAEIGAMRNMFHSCGSNAYGKYSNSIKVV